MQQVPEILNSKEFLTEEINVKWDKDSVEYFLLKIENDKLTDALRTLNHKAIIGLSAATLEWIFWRISEIFLFKDTSKQTDTLWLGLIDKRYIKVSECENFPRNDIYDDILWVASNCFDEIHYHYTIGSYRILYKVVNLIMLARYITPDKKIFDDWLNDCIKRSAKLFPARYNADEAWQNRDSVYDSSDESPIPREFYFEPEFDYETADIDGLLAKFINEVDHSDEMYFKSAERMLEEGFQGTPYKYKQK